MSATRYGTSTTAASGGFIKGALGANLASATTIVPTDFAHVITGTATITTITAPISEPHILTLFSQDGFRLAQGGNFVGQVGYVAPGRAVLLYYDGTSYYSNADSLPTSNVVYVDWYGADPTGVADSRAAFIAAHAALPSTGGEIIFSPGTYSFSAGITVTKPVVLRGSGWSTSLTCPALTSIATFLTVSGIATKGTIVKDLSFNGNRSTNPATVQGIGTFILIASTHVTVRNCEFKNGTGFGIVVQAASAGADCKNNNIEECYFHDIGSYQSNATAYAIFAGLQGTGVYPHLNVRNCRFDTISCPYATANSLIPVVCAIAVNAIDCVISGNYFRDIINAGGMIFATGSDPGSFSRRWKITNNHFEMTSAPSVACSGIELVNSDLIITGNTFKNLNGRGVVVEALTGQTLRNWLIADNVFDTCALGIEGIAGGGNDNDITIRGNTFYAPTTAGIKIPALGNNWLIDGNRFLDVALGGTAATCVTDAGTNTRLVNNYATKTDNSEIVLPQSVQANDAEHVAVRRLRTTGTALTAGDIATSGWGGAGLAVAVSGTDMNCRVTITAGAAPSANPSFTITFKDGAWSAAPRVFAVTNTAGITAFATSTSTTATTITWNGTPTATLTYFINVLVVGN